MLTRIYTQLDFNWTSKEQQQREWDDSSMSVQVFNFG
jgi:hypothetical protein